MNQETQTPIRNSPVYFLDFEASSLDADSWPIEIGIARVVDDAVVTKARLIRPHPYWSEGAWSEASAEIHGLSRARLDAEGYDAWEVAAWFKDLNTGIAVTDNPEFERRWLIRLLATDPPFPGVRLLDFDSYLRISLPDAAAVTRAYRSLENQGPPPHRAGPDAERLARAWASGAAMPEYEVSDPAAHAEPSDP